jgi:hypothetical protein
MITLAKQLDSAELYNFHMILSAALSSHSELLVNDQFAVPSGWDAGLRALEGLYPSGVHVLRSVQVVSRAHTELVEESHRLKSSAVRLGRSDWVRSDGAARMLAYDDALKRSISAAVGWQVTPVGEVNYHYYDQPGDGLEPHVDPARTSLISCVTVIEHEGISQPADGSALVVFRAGGERERVVLESGDVAALLASGTVHARESVANGESLTTLTIGFGREAEAE